MAVQAPPPTGYLEIERALRLLALGESDLWIAGKLHGVDHPAAVEAAMLLGQGRRRQAQAMLETTLLRLAGAPHGRGLGWLLGTSGDPRRPWVSPSWVPGGYSGRKATAQTANILRIGAATRW